MAKGYIGSNTYKCFFGNVKMKKGYIGGTRVYSAGEIVTYIIDTGITKQEEVDEGSSTLSPKTFTPSKTGWTFIGWRSDKTANGSVLTSKIMGDSPITLYAVFRQTITVSYDGNGHTGGSTASQTGYRYYNNGNVANPSFTLQSNGFTKTGYVFDKWTNSGNTYSAGQKITISTNMVMYATYLVEQEVTTWDKTLVYPWPGKEWTGYWTIWNQNGLNTTKYTQEEIDEQVKCWVASSWISRDGEHAREETDCLKAYVDCSKYKGIIIPLFYVINNGYDNKTGCTLYLSGGGTTITVASVPTNTSGPEETKTFTLLFKQTSGTTNVLIYNTKSDGSYIKGYAEVAGEPILLRR